MRILYDDNMPYAGELFPMLGEAEAFNHQTILEQDLSDVAALMVRSTTKVNPTLLAKMPRCQYVATATAGTNHMDFAELEQRGIHYTSAAGCNAESVAEYALAAALHGLYALNKISPDDNLSVLTKLNVGVIGVGEVGRRVAHKFRSLGCRVVLSDPPRASNENDQTLDRLDEVLKADVICCHAPLVKTGPFPSWHILNAEVLASLSSEQLLINAGRGEIIDNQSLLALKQKRQGPKVILDVWENEPEILTELIPYCDIATPHIAGHSLEGKARGTFMLFTWLCKQLNQEHHLHDLDMLTYLPAPEVAIDLNAPIKRIGQLKTLVDVNYDITIDHSEFVQNMAQSSCFAKLRKQYRNPKYNPNTKIRREFATCQVTCSDASTLNLLNNLGFNTLTVV